MSETSKQQQPTRRNKTNTETDMKRIFGKIRHAKEKSTDEEHCNKNVAENEKSKIGLEYLVPESKESEWPHSHLSSSFSSALQCLQLKRDIDQMLDTQWVMENCGEKKEQLCLSNMEVGNMFEFLEKLLDVDSSGPLGEKSQSRLRRYELVDRRKAVYPEREEMRYFRGTLLPSHLCKMLERDIDEPLNVGEVLMNAR